jgi:hypothetical protein
MESVARYLTTRLDSKNARNRNRDDEYVVKEQVDKILSAIIYIKDFISSAASLEPHAALAWAGVSVFLPVSLWTEKKKKLPTFIH